MNEEEKIRHEKFIRIVEFIKKIHSVYLFNFLHRSLYDKLNGIVRLSFQFTSDESIKFYLLRCLEDLKSEYTKIFNLCTKEVPDIYKEIFDLINAEFPCFPHDWEEYNFKRLMDKTFSDNYFTPFRK
jgi:hypothetical protein